jgi:hypothetical protein
MEVALKTFNLRQRIAFEKALSVLFDMRSPDNAYSMFWQLFEAWTQFSAKKMQFTDKEIALFPDQLIDLVAAAHIEHEANRASGTGQEGRDRD